VAGDVNSQDQDLLMRMQAAGDLYQNHLQRLVALRAVAMQESNVDQLMEIDRLFDELESQHMVRMQSAESALSAAGRQLMHQQWDDQMARMATLRRDFVQRRAERDNMFNTRNTPSSSTQNTPRAHGAPGHAFAGAPGAALRTVDSDAPRIITPGRVYTNAGDIAMIPDEKRAAPTIDVDAGGQDRTAMREKRRVVTSGASFVTIAGERTDARETNRVQESSSHATTAGDRVSAESSTRTQTSSTHAVRITNANFDSELRRLKNDIAGSSNQ
jgi:hypothetical protein